MKIGVTVQIRCPQGSVEFQSHIDAAAESIRHCRKELQPNETWVWNVQHITPDQIAFFAAQSVFPASLLINSTETLMEGQCSTDFGVAYARRLTETFGTLPFNGALTAIQVTNESDKANRVDIMFGEVPLTLPVVTEP